MPASSYSSFVLPQVQLSSSAEVQGTEPEPDKFNFLSFLATAQALQIDFLPLVWDITHDVDKGFGGTSIIYQALVKLDTSFAFKTYRKQQKTEEQVFRILINEITVLSETSVREHANIALLQGICWEISPIDDKPWPVLVFEKSHHGDLDHFARHGGRGMTINDRLRLCLDVGRAVMDMHTNQIVHGDIKPKNVLVFKEASGEYRAKVIDFGYSTKYIRHDQRLQLPRSKPWHAPEIPECNDRRRWEWTPSQATKTDLFSFGMLCLWLLFEPSLSRTKPPSQSVNVVDVGSPTPAEKILGTKKGELQTYVQQLLASNTTLEHETKMALKEFFDSSLSKIPDNRELSLSTLLRRLNPQRTPLPETPVTVADIKLGLRRADVKIETTIYNLYRSDYRVRSYIADCLLRDHSQSPSLAVQAAFCYYIGFGTARDQAKAEGILSRANQDMQVVRDMVSNIHLESRGFRASTLSELVIMGHIPWSDFSYSYLEQKRLDEAEVRLIQEKDDLSFVYGEDHFLTELSRTMLSPIYTIQGRWGEAEKLEVQVMETSKTKLGADHPNTLTSMANLASTYRNQGRWEEAEKLFVQVMETRKAKLGADHPSTLTSMANLASTFWNQGR